MGRFIACHLSPFFLTIPSSPPSLLYPCLSLSPPPFLSPALSLCHTNTHTYKHTHCKFTHTLLSVCSLTYNLLLALWLRRGRTMRLFPNLLNTSTIGVQSLSFVQNNKKERKHAQMLCYLDCNLTITLMVLIHFHYLYVDFFFLIKDTLRSFWPLIVLWRCVSFFHARARSDVIHIPANGYSTDLQCSREGNKEVNC